MPSGRNAKPVVGAYYYPWYRKPPRANAGQWMHVMRLPDKMPLDEGGKSEPPEAPIR